MYKELFSPIKIGNLEIKNRMVVAPMSTQYCERDGKATERYIAYHEAKAKGGWGMIITEDYPIEENCGAYTKLPGLWSDDQIESHKRLTDRVHQHNAKICCQIYHAGRVAHPNVFIGQPMGPSAIKDPTRQYSPREMTLQDIRDVVEQFGDAALRAKKAGFDMVEIHGGHGYLVAQFLSSFSNKRSDQYGGSLNNRCRFMVEIIKNVRGKVGEDYPIQLRISTVEDVEGGLDIAQTQAISKIAEQAGVDSIHASQGVLSARIPIIPPYAIARGAYANNAAAIKSVVKIPVIGVGRINEPDLAETLLAAGKMDMVAMGRASLADPEMPNKAKEGRIDDIRYCIACMQGCYGENARTTNGIRCLVNPELGLEYRHYREKDAVSKKVMIVGGGIAGCEAAIISAEKGHDVSLWEAGPILGGQWHAAAMPPGKSEFNSFLYWQKVQLEKLKVDVKLNTMVTEEILKEQMPDILLIATGSAAMRPRIPGIDRSHVITANDILVNGVKPGKNIVVIGGGLVGAETAQFIAKAEPGSKVSIIEMLPEIAKDGELPNNMLLIPSLKNAGVDMHTEAICKEIGEDYVIFEMNGEQRKIEGVDQIVLAAGMRAINTLTEISDNLGIMSISIGDAANSKNGLRNLCEAFDACVSWYHLLRFNS